MKAMLLVGILLGATSVPRAGAETQDGLYVALDIRNVKAEVSFMSFGAHYLNESNDYTRLADERRFYRRFEDLGGFDFTWSPNFGQMLVEKVRPSGDVFMINFEYGRDEANPERITIRRYVGVVGRGGRTDIFDAHTGEWIQGEGTEYPFLNQNEIALLTFWKISFSILP